MHGQATSNELPQDRLQRGERRLGALVRQGFKHDRVGLQSDPSQHGGWHARRLT